MPRKYTRKPPKGYTPASPPPFILFPSHSVFLHAAAYHRMLLKLLRLNPDLPIDPAWTKGPTTSGDAIGPGFHALLTQLGVPISSWCYLRLTSNIVRLAAPHVQWAIGPRIEGRRHLPAQYAFHELQQHLPNLNLPNGPVTSQARIFHPHPLLGHRRGRPTGALTSPARPAAFKDQPPSVQQAIMHTLPLIKRPPPADE